MRLKKFLWAGINKKGALQKGEIQAPNIRFAKSTLTQQGITIKKVRPTTLLDSLFSKSVKTQDIINVLEQLSNMLQAGLDLLSSLELLINHQTSQKLSSILTDIKNSIVQGESLSIALSKHPKYFDQLTQQLLRIGEHSGNLEGMIRQAAQYKQEQTKLNSQLLSALIYPAAVLFIATLVTLILLIFVIPQFQTFFADYDHQLPWLTSWIIAFSEILRHYYFWILLLCAIPILIFYLLKKHSARFNWQLDKLALKLPLLGRCFQESMLSRSANALATMFSAGLPLPESLEMIASLCSNQLYQQAWRNTKTNIEQGQGLAASLEKTALFPSMCFQMIATGENTGKLDSMLKQIALFYAEALERKVYRFKELLEPCMMLVLGVIIGILIIAMYLPIFKLGTVIG